MSPPILTRLREHPDAPRFNHQATDRLDANDLLALERFREALDERRGPRALNAPHPAILEQILRIAPSVPSFRRRIPGGLDAFALQARWTAIETMSREDLAIEMENLVPDDADLDGMIVYRTAGTTGHALLVPHSPRAVASYQPLMDHALKRWNVPITFDGQSAGCFLVGAQARTVTYATVLSAWSGCGFAKLNLRTCDWPRPDSASRYFAEFSPPLLTGDPISFAEMMRQEIEVRPRALISTAVAMSRALRDRLSKAYGCRVIDWYSLTETGPIGYLCPRSESYHLLPHDVHVEALLPDGRIASTEERGEIAVSGGRNPYLPLLRYRTGDFGRIDPSPCPCGDPMPRILDLEGRAPVLFRAADKSPVNAVDLSRILREFPFVQHQFVQHSDGACTLTVRPAHGIPFEDTMVKAALGRVLGEIKIAIVRDEALGDRMGQKLVPYKSEHLLED